MRTGEGRLYTAITAVVFTTTTTVTKTIANLLSLESARPWSNNFTDILIWSSQKPKSSRKLRL